MQLIGSVTSPYVRRIRLFLASIGMEQAYEFIHLDIYSPEGRITLTENNPAKKIPILKDDGLSLFDSRIIFNYLSEKYDVNKLSWSQQNLLTMIDAANDSLVSLALSERSGFDVSADMLFFQLQQERVASVLSELNQQVLADQFARWQYPEICLFCLLDWIEFRQLTPWHQHQGLLSFYQKSRVHLGVADTDPR